MAKLSRRLLLGASAGGMLLMTLNTQAAGNRFLAVRIWPEQSYTRVTLESEAEVQYKYFLLENPYRLVIDAEEIDLNAVLSSMASKIPSKDPYIANIRTAQKDNKTVRIVFDLKKKVSPKVFSLSPSSNLNHRLVIDFYGENNKAEDPIQVFWNNRKQQGNRAEKGKNKRAGRRPIIMLDPGHGGKDRGASSPHGLHEKDVVLSIARETRKLLESSGYKVLMTRSTDEFIPLRERTAMAQKAKADLFVSIHADSVKDPEPRGGGVYMLSQQGASSESARLLAESENAVDNNIAGVKMVTGNEDVNQVLMNMVQTQTLNDSSRLARFVLNHLGKHNKVKNEINRANFVVLRSPEIPSILVETAFLSNPHDEALLRNMSFRRKVAQSITDGIKQYLGAAVLARR